MFRVPLSKSFEDPDFPEVLNFYGTGGFWGWLCGMCIIYLCHNLIYSSCTPCTSYHVILQNSGWFPSLIRLDHTQLPTQIHPDPCASGALLSGHGSCGQGDVEERTVPTDEGPDFYDGFPIVMANPPKYRWMVYFIYWKIMKIRISNGW